MNEWKVTFLIRGKDNIAVNVKSNNEMFARQNAIRKLLMQYQHLNSWFNGKSIDYLAMPNYPTNRDTFRAGVAWHFYN